MCVITAESRTTCFTPHNKPATPCSVCWSSYKALSSRLLHRALEAPFCADSHQTSDWYAASCPTGPSLRQQRGCWSRMRLHIPSITDSSRSWSALHCSAYTRRVLLTCVCLSAIVKWTIAYVFFPSKLGFLRILMDRKMYFLNTPPDTLRLICIASCRADNDNDNGLMLTHTFADVMQFSPHMCSSHAQFLRNVIFIYHKFSFFIYFHLFDAITLSVLPMPLLLLRLV